MGALLALFVLAQAQRIAPLMRWGRGDYSAAVEYILSNSSTKVVGIGSDHDFRNKVLLAFYTKFLPEPNRLFYIHQPQWQKSTPDWIITHNLDMSYRPPKQLAIPDVGKYRLVRIFRSAGISGWHWFLFRQE